MRHTAVKYDMNEPTFILIKDKTKNNENSIVSRN